MRLASSFALALLITACSDRDEKGLAVQKSVLQQELRARQSVLENPAATQKALAQGQAEVDAMRARYATEPLRAQLLDAGIAFSRGDAAPAMPSITITRFELKGTQEPLSAARTLRGLSYPSFRVSQFETLDGGFSASLDAYAPTFNPFEPTRQYVPLPPGGAFQSSRAKDLRVQLEVTDNEFKNLGKLLADKGLENADMQLRFFTSERQHLKLVDQKLSVSKNYVPEDIDLFGADGPFSWAKLDTVGGVIVGEATLKPDRTKQEAAHALQTARQFEQSPDGKIHWSHPPPLR